MNPSRLKASLSLRLLITFAGCVFGLASVASAITNTNSIAYRLARHDPLSLAAQVGQRMFYDKSLSGSGRLACTSCHDPDHAYAPANDLDVQPGGKALTLTGIRAVPSLRYKQVIPPYTDFAVNPDGVSAPAPGGGYTQDGRAATLADQARIPLLSVNEMANDSPAAVVAKIRAGDYAGLFERAFGPDIFSHPDIAFQRATEALQAFQLEDYSFHPFSSKYDLWARNKIGGTFTIQEKRGFAVFMNREKGNCSACHYPGPGLQGTNAMFTDYAYAAIGVPRNPNIAANRNSRYYDLGICSRPDHANRASAHLCGMFKTPTLRNVATRHAFFHNGRIKTLHDAISFYATRDTNPERWYPTVHGVVLKYDDLPKRYQGNIDRQMPLDGRPAGSQPPLTEQDIDDLEAFLNTLTDDYESAPAER